MPETPFIFEKELANDFLCSIYDDDLEYAAEIFEQYLQQLPKLIKEMEESYQKGILEQFRQKIHKAKPVFSYVGLSALTEQSEQLEKQCKIVFDISEVSLMFTDLKNAIENFKPVIERQLIKLKEQISV